MSAPRFTAREKAEAAEREAKQRRRVYPRWTADGRMTQSFADRQVALMDEIAAEYAATAEAQEKAERLI